MKITVWSVLSGKASGHIVINVPETLTIGDILDKFLSYKGATKCPGYVIRSKDNIILNPHKTLKQADIHDGEILMLGLSDISTGQKSSGLSWSDCQTCYLRHLKKWSRVYRVVKNSFQFGVCSHGRLGTMYCLSHFMMKGYNWRYRHLPFGSLFSTTNLDDEEQTFSFGSWYTVALMTLVIGAVGLGVSLWIFLDPVTVPQKFGVVMDAGSSHSELFVFSWKGDKPLGTADVKLLHRCFVAGGVNSFASHAEDLGRYLGKCVAEAEMNVPKHLRKETPLYVGATAGMRILRDFEPDAAVAVLATLRNFLETNSTFKVDNDNILIIPGYEEGTSGWIAVNYLIGSLKKAGQPTKAALDVGGASFQLTMALGESGNWTTRPLSLFNHTYKIQSQSFLCYGIGQAQHRHNFLLVKGNESDLNEGNSSISKSPVDPCLPKGASHEITESDLNGPCTYTGGKKPELAAMTRISQNKLKKILKNYKGEVQDDTIDVLKVITEKQEKEKTQMVPKIITGSSNAKECNQKIGQLFDVELCKNTFKYGDCMNALLVPKVTEDVVAFSGLFYHLMILLQVQPYSSLSDYKLTVDHVCSLDAPSLYKVYPGVDKDILEDLCFDAMYVYKLLTVGLGIDNSSWSKIDFNHQVNEMDIEWPLGFMLNQTTSFPPAQVDPPLTIAMFTLLVFLFASILISGILFLRHSMKIKKPSASYQRHIADHIDHELHKFI